jgi:hypothetical protein
MFSSSFFKWAAVLSLLSGILGLSALLLDFFYNTPSDFVGQMALKDSLFYMVRQWSVLFMMIATLTAFWGFAAAKLNRTRVWHRRGSWPSSFTA